jgi:hypothetical protein
MILTASSLMDPSLAFGEGVIMTERTLSQVLDLMKLNLRK